MNFGRTARNIETLEEIYGEKSRELTGASEEAEGRRSFPVRSGRCSAEVGAEMMVDGGGGVPEAERREEDDAKRHGGKR